jgi:hypothetical protein
MILPVRLSDNEIKQRGEKLADLLREIGEKESEKSVETKKFASAIKELEVEADTVAQAIRSGQEDRDVEIERRPDFKKETVEIIRIDTGEVVVTEALSDSDRQTNLSMN